MIKKIGVVVKYHANLEPDDFYVKSVTMFSPNEIEEDFEAKHRIISNKPTAVTWPIPLQFEFAGWNTKPDGTGKSYKVGDYTQPLTEDFDLYAQWKLRLENLNWQWDYLWDYPIQGEALFDPSNYSSGSDWKNYEETPGNGDKSVSYINIKNNTVRMIGNGVNPGKGACWADFSGIAGTRYGSSRRRKKGVIYQ